MSDFNRGPPAVSPQVSINIYTILTEQLERDRERAYPSLCAEEAVEQGGEGAEVEQGAPCAASCPTLVCVCNTCMCLTSCLVMCVTH